MKRNKPSHVRLYLLAMLFTLLVVRSSIVVLGDEGTVTPTPVSTPDGLTTPLPTDGVTLTPPPTDTPAETPTDLPAETPTDVPAETPTDVPTAEATEAVTATDAPESTETPTLEITATETTTPTETPVTATPDDDNNVVSAVFSLTGDDAYNESLGGWNVCFTDESTGAIESWAWDFGNSATSTEASPCHLYTSAGVYTVTLSVVGGDATSSAVQVLSLIQPDPLPTAAYASNKTSTYRNDAVDFYDRSTGTIDTWAWDFGDGATSTDRNPSHAYAALGNYTVRLTVTGVGGSSTVDTLVISVIERPLATLSCDFSAPNIFEDTLVTLDGRVSNAPAESSLSYAWLIGTTEVGTSEDLSYTFADAGSYSVTFTVTASTGETCSRNRTLTVKSSSSAFAAFNRTPSAGAAGTSVVFTDRSVGSVVAWAWDFGDGATSTDQNPAHVYNTPGTYTARLTITAADNSTSSATARVTIYAPQSLSIIANPTTGIAPLSVALTAVFENINVSTLEWTFPNGTKAYGADATYIFRTGGEYTVRVQGSGALGLITATQDFRIGSLSRIRASFVPDRWTGDAPLRVCFTDQSAGENINSWLWDSSNGQTSTEQNPCFTYSEGGDYTVRLTVGNEYGLSADASNIIRVVGIPPTEEVTPTDVPTVEPTDEVIIDLFDPSLSKLGYLPAGSTGLPGEELVWEVTVTNNGGAPSGDTIVTDTLRSELIVKSVSTPVGTSSIVGQLVTVTIPPSALQNSGDSVTFTILTEVVSTPFDNRIDNTAEIQGEGIQATAEVEVDGGFVIALAAPPLPSGPIPQIIDTTQNTGFAGISQCMTVGFINQGTNPGFGPYFTVVLEQGTDGLTLDSLSFLGTNLLGGGFLIAQGVVPAGSWVAPNDPIEGRPIPQPPGYQSTHNYIWYTVRLPVGSVVTNGPVLDIQACYQVGPLAEIEAPYTLDFYPGYEFGDSATGIGGPDGFDEPISNLDDRANPNPAASDNHGTFTPVLVTLSKANSLPESEVPPSCYPNTGAIANPGNACPGGGAGRPQWPYEYTINIELAPGQTIHNLTFVDTLDSQFQLYPFSAPALPATPAQIVRLNNPVSTCALGTQSVTLNGSPAIPFTPISPATAGGTLGINFTSVTNSSLTNTCVVNMTYRGFVIDILDETNSGPDPDVESIFNEVDFNYDWPTPGNPRTQLTTNNTVDVRNQLFQKSANPTSVRPDDVVTYTVEFQVSEYTGIQTLEIVDTIPDGLEFNVGSATFSLNGAADVPVTGANVTVSYTSEEGTITFNITGALPGPYPLGSTGTLTYTADVLQQYRAGGTLDGFISANDSMTNTLEGNFTTTDGGSFTDDTAATVAVGPNTLTKDLVSTPTDATTGFVPGEPVTFRLVFDIPSGDTRNVLIEDFFPLPVFDVADPDFGLRSTVVTYTSATAPGGPTETFELIAGSTPLGYCASYPNATFPAYANSCGVRIVYGPGNTTLPAGSDFTVTVDAATNSVQVGVDADIVTNVTVGRRVVLEFTAAVIDQPFNDNLFLSNLARTTYTDSRNNSVNVDAIDYLDIAAPDVQLCKGIESSTNPSSTLAAGTACGVAGAINNNITNADAGDQIVYAITIRNVGGARAYNVQVDDNIFSNTNPPTSNPILNTRINSCTLLTVTDGGGTTIPAVNYTVTGATPFSRIQFAGSIPGDRSAGVSTAQATRIIRYRCTVSGTVTPGEGQLTNTARTRFTPFDDTLPNGTHLNPTTGIFPDRVDTASVVTRLVTLTKTRTPASVAIGDIVTYTLTLTVPGGTLPNVNMVDVLDLGLAFVDCTSVNVTGSITSSVGTIDTATFCNDGTVGGSNPIIFSSGELVTWGFGTLTNPGTPTDNPAVITIVYTAVALNVTPNVEGTQLGNAVELTYTIPTGTAFVGATAPNAIVREPRLQVAKTQQRLTPTVSPASPTISNITNADAGDTIRYTLLISHTLASTTMAYDITMSDTIPANTTYVAGSATTTALCNVSESGGVISVTATSLTTAQSCTITFDVTLNNTVEPRQTLTNQVIGANNLRWTSVAGTTPPERDDYNASGVERSGDCPASPVNTYCANSNVVNVVIPDPTVNKIVTATSETFTGTAQHGAPNDLTIGETVTYQITYTFREGVTDAVFLRDVLPTTTVNFSVVSSQIVLIGANLASSNPLLINGLAGTVAGNVVEWSAGSVTNTPNQIADAGDTIVVQVIARVTDNDLNVGVNPGADVNVSNTGRIVFNDFANATTTIDETEPVDIVEPLLQHTKTTTTAMPIDATAGNTVVFQLVISHAATSTANAFNVIVSDTLPPHMTFGAVTNPAACGGITTGGTSTVPTFSFATLALGGTCTINFNARLNDTVLPSSSYQNAISTQYDSQPTFVTGETRRKTVAPATSLVTTTAPTLTKTVFSTDLPETTGTNVNPGETVTYRLTATLIEGTQEDFVIRDTLPTGVSYVSSQVISIGGSTTAGNTNGGNLTGGTLAITASCANAAQNVTCTFGDVVNAANDAGPTAVDQIIVEIVGRVADAAVTGTVLTNTADIQHTRETCTFAGGCTPTTTDTPDVTANVTVVAPNITITKSATPITGDAGDIITYTIVLNNTGNGPAYNTTATDILQTLFVSDAGTAASLVCGGLNSTVCTYTTATDTITATYSVILPGTTRTITYTVVLLSTVPASGEIINVASQTNSTRPDNVCPAGPGRCATTTDDATVTVQAPLLDKRIISTSFTPTTPDSSGVALPNNSSVFLTQGETATYEFIVTVPEGSTNALVLTDTLPSGMSLVSSSVFSIGGSTTAGNTFGGNISGSSLAIGAACAFATPVVTCTFGNVTNTIDNLTTTADEIRVRVVARVNSTTARSSTQTDTARVTYTGAPPTPITDTETITVVAPNPQIVKTFNPSISFTGGIVQLRLVVTNPVLANVSTAYNVVVLDQISGFMDNRYELLPLTLVADVSLAPGTVLTSDTSTGGFGTSRINLIFDELDPGETITITANVRVDPLLNPSNVIISNDTRVSGDSVDPTSPDYPDHGTTSDDDNEPLIVQPRLAGKVWRDDDRDGNTNDIGPNPIDEKPFNGVTVRLCSDAACTTVVDTTTTNINGDYGFAPVPPGTYFIRVTPPVGYDPTFDPNGIGTPNVTTVVITTTDIFDLNFGYVSQASLGDRVWLDTNGNTLQDVGEVGVPGRVITLAGTDSLGFSITRTTTTIANGIYLFADLPPSTGEYTITVTNPPAGTTQTYDLNGIATAHQTGATLAPAQDRVDVDFGYQPNAAIGDRIWEDLDADGIQDVGENGIVGLNVTLTGTDAFGNPVSLTTTTGVNGIYNFTNLAPSDATGYTVTVTPPAGISVTYDRDGGIVTPNNATTIVLNPNEVVTDADFGYIGRASLGDRVWLDRNADGVQDAGEPGINGLTVTVTGTDINGIVVNRTTTTANVLGIDGVYTFANLTPSNATGYTVTVTPPAGVTATYNWDNEADNTATPDNANTGTVLASGDDEILSDFGYVGTSSLGDRVWADFDGDGVQDAGEPGLVGITVTLTGTDSLGNGVILTTTTAANGIYTFDDLVPSNAAGYTVTVTPPVGSTQTYDLNGVGTPNTTPAVVTATGANQNRTDVDFGYRGNSSIGDRLWLDNDADGVQDAGEPGMPGITITLTGTDTFGNPVNLTTTTGANGIYNFPNLFPSDATGYTVTVTAPSGVNVTFDRDGGILTPNNNTTIVLPPATAITNADFGYRGTGSIGDRVWRDLDNDGVQDAGELGINGRTVTLTGTDAFGNAITRTLTTATVGINDGFYLFDNLPPSNATGYRVTVTQPPSLSPTYDLDGVASPNSTLVPFALGGTRTDVDFGYNNIGFISGNVWRDDNNSATKNGVEPNLEGIRVDLLGTDVDGNVVNLTTTTDINGNYVFPNLNGGSYTVRVVPPPGMANTYDNNTGRNNDTPVNLPVGGSRINVNFGYRGLGSLGDRVWLDLNGDTVQDVGEPGISGRTVTLVGVDQNGAAVNLTTTTSATGAYNFPNLPPSNAAGYTVTVTNPPAGVTPTYDADGNITGASSSVANGMVITPTNPGLNRTDVDFGYVGGGSIGDTVWLDTDADGTLNGAETGLPGLTVTLTGTNSLGQAVNLTQTTDANGNYLFSGLLAPTAAGYRVTVTPPAGVVQTYDFDGIATPNTSSGVNFNVTNTVLTQDFGYRGNSSIGDRVWEDRNGDGVQDAGEPGIPGLLVTLTGTNSLGQTVTLTTTTAANGLYLFPNLLPGTYSVTVASPSGMIVTSDRDGNNDNTTLITLPANTNIINADFGYRGTAALGDRVWEDRDGDGAQDSGEQGFNGLTVTLTGTDVFGNAISRTTTTAMVSGVDGVYNFTNLPPSNGASYIVTVTTPPAGFVATYDLNGAGTPHITDASLNGGQTRLDVDFGYRGTSSLSGTVWRNDNSDSVVDGGEPRLPSVTVTLTGTDINGNSVTFTTTTDPSGNYTFPNLPAGSYTVTVPTPPGTPNFDADGVATPNVIVVTVPVNTNVTNQNLGYIGSGILGDRVWLDRDGDGIQDADEPGVAGIVVTLRSGATVIATDTTDSNGNYLFSSLPTAGALGYTVSIGLPAGYVNTDDLDATPDGTTTLTTFSDTETRMDVDFGIRGNGSVGDRVWLDIDGGADQDAGEPGIPSLTMRLTGMDVQGNTYDLTTTTAANGLYTFPNMPPSNLAGYTVTVVTPPTGTTPTFDFDGVITGVSANVANNVVVTDSGVNQNRTDVDFGYRPTSSVGGTLWRDDNNNERINAGEPDMNAGITVTLTGTDAFGNAISLTTTTDANGNYLFQGVPPSGGTGYTITVPTPPTGFINTFDGLKNTDDTGKNNDIPNVVVNPNEIRTGLDFGYRGTGSIGDLVWLDADGNGVQNGGEPGISGRTVTLTGTDTLGNTVSFTTTTDASGNYLFPNLPPSDASGYTLTVTNPITGTTQTYDLDGIGTPNIAVATLGAGQNRTDVDFGYRGNASLGDTVWVDYNNNGVQDAFEPGQTGVTVTLTGKDINGNLVNINTTTDASGNYLFPGLLPSSAAGYTVTLTAGVPAGLLVGTELDNGAVNSANPNGISSNNRLNSNQNRTDVDFGLIGSASIAGKVWRDDDASGTDNTEPNFRGVVVSLVWNGNIIATRTTNAAGEYLFDDLPPGDYTVVIERNTTTNERLNGFTQTFDADGTGTPDVIAVTLPANFAETNQDFGYRGTGSIGDLVWQDINGNRVFDGTDVPLQNITLRLTGTDQYGNPVSQTDITDVNGNYLFNNLPRGTYTVTVVGAVTDPFNGQVLSNTYDPDGGATGTARVVLGLDPLAVDPLTAAVETRLTIDFGYRFVPAPVVQPPTGGGGGTPTPDVQPTPITSPTPPAVFSETLELPTLRVPVIPSSFSDFTNDTFASVILDACTTECVDYQFYHTNRTGNWEIFRLGDYRDRTDANPNISQGEGAGMDDVAPSRSPNAEWVAFASNRDGNWEIYIAPSDGTTANIRRVTTNSIAIDTNPVWGPNNQIIYETTRNGSWDLYVVDMITGVSTPLITSQGNDINADWSADGTKVLFQSDRYGSWQLYELDLQTRTIRILSDDTANDTDPQYNSTDSRISFLSDRTGSAVIYVMDSNLSNLRAVSEETSDAANATWSPTGNLIAYQSDRDGDLDVYVVDATTNATRQITDNTLADFAPSWLCGTNDLLFTSDAQGDTEIYRTTATPLTDPAIDVAEDATRETEDTAQDVYPMGAPVNEYASREGLMAGTDMLAAANTDFLQPDTNVTPRDPNQTDNVDWDSVVGCTSRVCQPWNVYLSNPAGVWNIFRLDAADSALNLSNGQQNDYSPSLSPDKRFIAFTSLRDGDAELFVVMTDGSGLQQLTDNTFVDDNPTWALDGQYLVYEAAPSGNFDLYRRDLTTGITTQLTTNTADERNPFMSFGNGQVLFQSNRDGREQIYELTLATNQETRLSDGTANDSLPIYAYDGGKILFNSDRDGVNALYIMDRDGTNVTRISPQATDARNGAWSLDSQFIAFQADIAGDTEIFVYEVATARMRQVTENTAADTTPAWRCDTGDLLITSDIMGDPDIFEIAPLPISAPSVDLMTEGERLTSGADADTFPLGSTDEIGSREEIIP